MTLRFALAAGQNAGVAPYQPKQQDAALPVAPAAPGESISRGRERQVAPATVEPVPAAAGPANGAATSAPGHGHGALDQPQRIAQSRSHRRRSAAARSAASDLLALSGAEDLQDFLACMILSECVYKKVELSKEALVSTVSSLIGMFPPGWVSLEALEISRSDLQQHYLLATGGDALYVAFMGTKQPRDLVTDATFLHKAVWAESVALASDKQSVPAAHSGFLQRARAINVEQLHELAAASGRRLVLCGHSLGGAVAKLSTLRLLRDMPQWPAPKLKCICFATPAVGNAALADLVTNAGWGSHFKTYFLPEDQVMHLMRFSQTKPKASAPVAASSSERAGSAQLSDCVEAGLEAGAGPTHEPRARRWSWPGTTAKQAPPEPALSMVSSMDAAEAAMEDILSSAPPAPPFNLGLAFALQQKRLFRAVEKLAGQARIPLPLPQAYFHTFGAQLFVHADRAYYSDQPQPRCPPVAAEAAAALQPGAPAVSSMDALDISSAGSVAASPCLSHSVKGPFNYHRMISHRLRVLSIIGGVLPEEQRAQHQARIAAATAAAAAAAGKAMPAPTAVASPSAPTGPSEAQGTAHSRPTPRSLSGRRAGISAPVQLQTEGLYPRICAQRATARPPVHLDLEAGACSQPSAGFASGGNGSGSSMSGGVAGGSPGTVDAQRGGSKGKLLAGLWGKRSAEEKVTLLMEVEGHNLQYCHHATARLSLGTSPSQGQGQDVSVALPTEVVRVVADPERVVHHVLSVLQDRLHQVAGSIGRYISRTKLDKAAAAAAPSSKMLVRITLPRSAAQQLASQSCAAPAPPPPTSAAGPQAASPPLAPPQACLTLHLKSHFHEDTVVASVQPYKAAVLGTSLTATTLLQAALLAPVMKPASRGAAAGAGGEAEAGAGAAGARGPGARLVEAATFAMATSSAVASWWAPQPLRWARRLWSPQPAPPTPATSLSGASPPHPSAFADAASQQQPLLPRGSTAQHSTPMPSGPYHVQAGSQAPGRPHLRRAVSDLAYAVQGTQLARTMSDAMRVVPEPLLGFSGASNLSPIVRRFSMDGNVDAAKAVAYAAYGTAYSGSARPQQQGQQQQARALRALQPVAGLFLVVRLIQQATARIVATRVVGAAAVVAGGAAAAQQAPVPMPAGAALLMRRRAASYAASVVMQQLEPQPRGSSSGGGGTDASGRVPVALGSGWLPSSVRLLADFGRAPYLQLVGNVLRPRWAGIGSRAVQTATLLSQTLPLRGGGGRDTSTLCSSSGGGGGVVVSRRRRGAWWGGIPWGLQRRPTEPADGVAEARTLLAHTSPLQLEEALLGHASLPDTSLLEAQLAAAVASMSASTDDDVADVRLGAATQPRQGSQERTATEPQAAFGSGPGGQGEVAAVEISGKRRPSYGLGVMRASTSGGQLQQLATEHHTSPRMLRSISYNAAVNSAGRAAGPSRQAQRKAAAAAGTAAAAVAAAPAPAAQPKVLNPRPGSAARRATRERQKAALLLGVPPETSCLGGSLVLHNVLARAPVASPFVVLRALTASLRRQASRLRRPGGAAPPPAPAAARRAVGPLHPAGALVHVYNWIRGIPFWIQQDWKVLLVAASALDPTRLLQGRDFARLSFRAKAAGVTLLPVLLTSELVPQQQEERTRLALGAACGVAAAAVRVVTVDGALLQLHALQEAAADDGAGAGEIAEKARALAGRATGVADIQLQLHALLLQQQEQQQQACANMHLCPSRAFSGSGSGSTF